jgi:hypothetical protein
MNLTNNLSSINIIYKESGIMKNNALIVSGLVFAFMAFMHALRYVKGWEIVIAQHTISMQVSIIGAIVAALLAIWMFVAASKN